VLVTVVIAIGVYWLTTASGRLDRRPDITLTTIDGRGIDLATMEGKPLLVNFWATTCAICMQEMPELIALYNDLSKQGLEVIAIAMPYDPPNLVLEVTKQFKLPYPVALDISGEAMRAFADVKATPATFLIAPDGRVIEQSVGRTDFGLLRREILELLADTGFQVHGSGFGVRGSGFWVLGSVICSL